MTKSRVTKNLFIFLIPQHMLLRQMMLSGHSVDIIPNIMITMHMSRSLEPDLVIYIPINGDKSH